MKTLSAFKRALQPGTKWECFHIPSNSSLGIREVEILQTNAVAFKRDDGKLSWLDFPKATEYDFKDGKAEIYWPGVHGKNRELVLTYQKV